MARPPTLPPEQRLKMFLSAVNDHPWAAPRHVQVLSGLRQREFYEARCTAQDNSLVEQVRIRTVRNPPQRYALLPAGAQLLGEPAAPLGALRDALLRALDLDLARLLLAKWAGESDRGLIWARSPFKVHARDLRPPPQGANRFWPEAALQDRTYRSLRLEGLACLSFPAPTGRFLHVAIIVDQGDVTLSWFFHQFRSVYAWRRRPEFRKRAGAFPVFVLLAANRTRLMQLTQLWRSCARWGTKPARLFATTRRMVEEHPVRSRPGLGSGLKRIWRNERQRPTRLWAGAIGTEAESKVPPSPEPSARDGAAQYRANWVGMRPPLGEPPLSPYPNNKDTTNVSRNSRTYGLLAWARKRQMPSARLVRDHLQIGARGRELLDRIGRYPLLSPVELAAVLDVSRENVYPPLGELAQRGLVERPVGSGYALSGRGLTLLAAQAGFPPRLYAELRRWPLLDARTPQGKALIYSTDYLLTRHAHARLVVLFMTGLLQAAKASRLGDWLDGEIRLICWDQEYLYLFPRREEPGIPVAELQPNSWVVPDAVGVLGVRTPRGVWVETEFWLEVDRSNIRGSKLLEKLNRYYAARGGERGTAGWLPRLLIVVESDDEARAQALRRRLEFLDRRYGRRLDALISRVDLLNTATTSNMQESKPQGLDATLPVWRRAAAWDELVYAFEGLPLQRMPHNDPRGIKHIDQQQLRAEKETRRKRIKAQRRRRAREREQNAGYSSPVA